MDCTNEQYNQCYNNFFNIGTYCDEGDFGCQDCCTSSAMCVYKVTVIGEPLASCSTNCPNYYQSAPTCKREQNFFFIPPRNSCLKKNS